MKKNYLARLVFPTLFHEYIFKKVDFKKDKKELIDFCYAQKKLHPKGILRSNYGGWHSPIYKIEDNNPISKYLKKGLGNSVFIMLKKNVAVKISYWIMINNPNSYNTNHTHPNSHLSGVFWIKAPKKSGELKFISPTCFESYGENKSYLEQFTKDTNAFEAYRYTPTEGVMVTFPSHIAHEVRRNESKNDRIAVSYNINLNCWDVTDE